MVVKMARELIPMFMILVMKRGGYKFKFGATKVKAFSNYQQTHSGILRFGLEYYTYTSLSSQVRQAADIISDSGTEEG